MSDNEALPETDNAAGEAAGTGSETGEQQDEQHDDKHDDQHDDGVRGANNASSVAAAPPAARVELASPSRSADAGHMSSADISSVASTAGLEFRLVGGNAISLLVWAHEVAAAVPERETNDADLGVPALATGSANLVAALK